MGILIASAAPNPVLGASFALLSHYILDIIPHEPDGELFYVPPQKDDRSIEITAKLNNRKYTSLFDLMGSLLLIAVYIYFKEIFTIENLIIPIVILFFAVFPDILTILYLKFPNKLLSFHYDFHYKIHGFIPLRMSYLIANLYQIIFSVGLLLLALKLD